MPYKIQKYAKIHFYNFKNMKKFVFIKYIDFIMNTIGKIQFRISCINFLRTEKLEYKIERILQFINLVNEVAKEKM